MHVLNCFSKLNPFLCEYIVQGTSWRTLQTYSVFYRERFFSNSLTNLLSRTDLLVYMFFQFLTLFYVAITYKLKSGYHCKPTLFFDKVVTLPIQRELLLEFR